MEETKDESQVLETETTETATEQPAEETTTEEPVVTDEEKETLRKENEDLKKKNAQLFERVKKEKEKVSSDLSNKDVLILAKANLNPEDIDEVMDYARFKKIALADALKSPVITTLLAERDEQRKTANATQTKGGARGTSKISGEELLAKAERTGEIPDSDEALAELIRVRRARKLGAKR